MVQTTAGRGGHGSKRPGDGQNVREDGAYERERGVPEWEKGVNVRETLKMPGRRAKRAGEPHFMKSKR